MMSILPAVDTVNTRQHSRFREALLPTGVGFSVMAASLVSFLNGDHYPMFTPEVGLVLVALGCFAFLMGLLYALVPPISRAVLQFLLLVLALDLNFDGPVVVIVAVVIAAVVNRHLIPFLGIVSLVVLVTDIPSISYAIASVKPKDNSISRAGDPSLPTLVHIILDEHIGIEGLIGDARSLKMRDELRSFYLDNGFRVFGGAFSEHLHTVNAIPAFLNFGQQQSWLPETSKKGTIVPNNRYFDELNRRGYAINVYQTSFADFCIHPAVASCLTLPPSLLLSLRTDTIETSDRAIVIGQLLAGRSTALQLASYWLNIASGLGLNLHSNRLPHGLPAIDVFELVGDELAKAQGGRAFFLHVLFPHYPYVFAPNCDTKPSNRWRTRRENNTSIQEIQSAYYEQLSCVRTALQPLFDAADERTILVVHGDHGSRITREDPTVEKVGRFSSNDMIAGFSTLFAVRAPTISPGYDRHALPTSLLFSEFVLSDFRSLEVKVPPGYQPTVVLDDSDWRPSVRHRLPANWPPAGQ